MSDGGDPASGVTRSVARVWAPVALVTVLTLALHVFMAGRKLRLFQYDDAG